MRIILYSAIIALLIISGILIFESELGSLSGIIFVTTLLSINIIPHKLIKWKNQATTLKSNFLYGLFLNGSVFLPMVIYEAIFKSNFDTFSFLILLFVIVILSFFSSLFITKFPKSMIKDEEIPIYAVNDVLLQPKTNYVLDEASISQIPMNTISDKSIALKILAWILIILMVVIPIKVFLSGYYW